MLRLQKNPAAMPCSNGVSTPLWCFDEALMEQIPYVRAHQLLAIELLTSSTRATGVAAKDVTVPNADTEEEKR